jgi:hypothetical protein
MIVFWLFLFSVCCLQHCFVSGSCLVVSLLMLNQYTLFHVQNILFSIFFYPHILHAHEHSKPHPHPRPKNYSQSQCKAAKPIYIYIYIYIPLLLLCGNKSERITAIRYNTSFNYNYFSYYILHTT